MRFKSVAFAALLAFVPLGLSAQSQTEQTIADFLEEYPDNALSDFITILKRTQLWEELGSANSYYTCFAPTNDAVRSYLYERRESASADQKSLFESVETLPILVADSIARTHIVIGGIRMSNKNNEYGESGTLPYHNLLKRLLSYRVEYDTISNYDNGQTSVRASYRINNYSKVIESDRQLTNGMVQIIDRTLVQSSYFIPALLHYNNGRVSSKYKADIFYRGLIMTGLSDTLEKYMDCEYPVVGYDSTYYCLETTGRSAVEYETAYETGSSRQRAVWPEQRFFKYTFFVVSDSILSSLYGINSIEDLIVKAKEVYPDPEHINDDFRLNTSPLYKLISYHILPCWLPYDQLNTSQPSIIKSHREGDYLDVEDYYETMQPYAIMRISTPLDSRVEKKGIYINRKGTVSAGNLENKGVRIWKYNEVSDMPVMEAVNGGYYYVDSLLLFNQVAKNALNTRMRFMFSTMSPDFINSGARGRLRASYNPTDYAVFAFKRGFCKNIEWSGNTEFYVRYRDASFSCYNGDEITVRGVYDLTFRLPPVPENGVYEVRISENAVSRGEEIGSALFYLRSGDGDFIPCGTPTDIGRRTNDPELDFIRDSDLETESAILDHDKYLHSRGYMKAPDSYGPYNSLRNDEYCYRKIVCEQYMESGKDYYLRIRQVSGSAASFIPLSYLEIVPRSVYSGEKGFEDKH